MSSPARSALSRTLPELALLAGTLHGAEGSPDATWTNVDPRLGAPVAHAVARAAERLEKPGCPAVLSDFHDSRTGSLLSDRLAETGQSPSGYLRWLTFSSGVGLRPCEKRTTLAYTSPGSRVVFVCREQFARAVARDEGFAANIVVHEALHTLGLTENPPTPNEITKAVEARCGR